MVIVRIWEGLGNQLFQYAYARALALRTGQRVYLDISEYEMRPEPIREYQLCRFKIRQPVIHCGRAWPFVNKDRYFAADTKYFRYFPVGFIKEEDSYYKEELRELKGLLYIKGWFQSERYFQEFADRIREEIYPKDRIRITQQIRKILEAENTVSVHVRRGDFKKARNILPREYYENAKAVISRSIKNPYYIIFSDDISYVKERMDFGTRCLYMDQSYSYEDYEELMIMSRCRHNIIANSTFSWWGAWLNRNENKVVVAPGKWFLCGVAKEADVIPAGWIRV